MSLLCLQLIIFLIRSLLVVRRPDAINAMVASMSRMIVEVFTFMVLLSVISFGFALSLHYMIAEDLNKDHLVGTEGSCFTNVVRPVYLHGFWAVTRYMFQVLMGQQDWQVVSASNSKCITHRRALMLQLLVITYSVIGTLLLLNLLIGIIASRYDALKSKEASEKIFVRAWHTGMYRMYGAGILNWACVPNISHEMRLVQAPAQSIHHYRVFGGRRVGRVAAHRVAAGRSSN